MRKLLITFATTGLLLLPAGAFAQSAVSAFGPHVGFSVGPDQIVLGAHMAVGEVAPGVSFNPGVDLGLGDNRTVFGINFDMHYRFEIRESSWRPYAGAGVGINFINRDVEGFARDESDTDVGGSLILGAGIPTRSGSDFFGEVKLGLGGPDLKMLVGWNFGR